MQPKLTSEPSCRRRLFARPRHVCAISVRISRSAHRRTASSVSLPRDLLQAALDHRTQLGGHVSRQRPWCPVDDCRRQITSALTLKRPRARYHLVERHAQCPDVAAPVHLLAAQLFRRHVSQRPHRAPVRRQSRDRLRCSLHRSGGSQLLRQPEVHHLAVARLRQHDVGRLDVPVDDPLAVGGLERFGDLDCDRQHLVG